MENFVVSARKYRPARFEDVVGQENVTVTLKNAIRSKQLAHAFLFCGPRGVGKTTCARILAKVINCQNPSPDIEACNECDSCKSFNNSSSFNVFEVDAASNSSVEDIRTLIEQVRYAPQLGKYKIYIIDEVHMLSQSAFNAFLKTLEEPPPYAIFILATTEKHKIIPTILSRCQIFDFNRIKTEDTVKHLQKICAKENMEAEPDALHIIAQKSDGALRDALSMMDRIVSFSGGKLTFKATIENLNILDYDYFFKATDYLLSEDVSNTLILFNEILQKGFDGDHFVLGLAEHFRNLLVCKDTATLQLLETSDKLKERYQQQSSIAPASFLLTALNLANDCDINYKMSKNKRLLVEMALLKMAYSPSAIKLTKEHQAIDSKKKLLNENKFSTEEKIEIGFVQEKKEIYLNTPSAKASENSSLNAPASSFKLKSLDSLAKEVQVNTVAEKEIKIDYIQTDIELENLILAWGKFQEKLKAEKKMSLYSLCQTSTPSLPNPHSIELIVENKMQLDLLEKEKNTIASFFQQTITPLPFLLSFRIEKKENSNGNNHRAYTTTDKFKEMVKKNPALLELKNRLEMDLEM